MKGREPTEGLLPDFSWFMRQPDVARINLTENALTTEVAAPASRSEPRNAPR